MTAPSPLERLPVLPVERLPVLFRLIVIRAGGITFIALMLMMPPLLVAGALLPRGPEVAYMSDALGSWDVYLMDVNRGVSMRLTTSMGNDRYPAWSPDGTTVVYHSDAAGDFDLYLVNFDGSDVRRLAAPAREIGSTDAMAAWSPDGEYIAYHAYLTNRESDLYLLELRSGQISRVTYDPSDDVRLSWSPDGTRVAFSSERADGFLDLYVMETGVFFELARSNALSDFQRNLPPDEPGNTGSIVLDILPAKRLTESLANDWYVSWSPDSEYLAFHSDSGLNYEVFVIKADGTEMRNLTRYPFADDHHPHWLPDGRILFASNRAGSYDLYVMDADGGNLRRLTFDPDANEDAPAWRP